METLPKPANPVALQIVNLLNDPDIELPAAKRAELENAVRLIETGASTEITPPNIPSDEPIPGHDVQADELRAQNGGNLPRPDAEIIRPQGYHHGDAPSVEVAPAQLGGLDQATVARLEAIDKLLGPALAQMLAGQQSTPSPEPPDFEVPGDDLGEPEA